jgi:hypothetical protein
MKVHCPSCERVVPAADVALDKGWAKCATCNEVFPLAERLPGYSATGTQTPAERPFDAWAIVRREPQLLAIHLPAYGMRAAAWGLLGFATFWLAFIAFWTAGALGVFFNQGQLKWENGLFAAFSTPFWLIGFGMLAGVVWSARGTRSVMIDPAHLVSELRCLFWRRSRSIERNEVQCARTAERVSKHEGTRSTPAVEIIFTKGSFQLPCNSTAEQEWLVAEINDFLQQVPYNPASAGFSDVARLES